MRSLQTDHSPLTRKAPTMTHHWDEFSKSLAQPLPRRESLRRLGVVLAGAVLSPLGLQTASAGHHSKKQSDPCRAFCKCRNKKQQDQCLKTCNACNKDTARLCGGCGNYVCCASGRVCCNGYYCVDLANDVANCGACGNYCYPGPWEDSACIDGHCEYACAEGADYCDGVCTFLETDFYNCGACGVACAYGELCSAGACVPATCGGGAVYCPVVYPGGSPGCTFLAYDPYNCGACGNVCPGTGCTDGVCDFGTPPGE